MSRRTFHNVSIDEIEAVLLPRGFKCINDKLPNVVERVYAKRVDQDDLQLSLRVFTGIEGSQSRDCGEDAIRIVLFYRDPKSGKVVKVSGEKRVNRIQTWQKNLELRLDKWDDFPSQKCPKCGSPMVKRNGKFGVFNGCSNWPACNYIGKGETQ